METRPLHITSEAFYKALIAAGVLREDESIRRIVIDVAMRNVVIMHIERIADTRLLDVIPTLDGVKVVTGE